MSNYLTPERIKKASEDVKAWLYSINWREGDEKPYKYKDSEDAMVQNLVFTRGKRGVMEYTGPDIEMNPLDAICLLKIHCKNKWFNTKTRQCLKILDEFVEEHYE